MTAPSPGSPERPLRVAVVGAGPAGFYTVEALLKHPEVRVDVDLLERLPAPYGLLRYGVAPDHPKIKNVAAGYDRVFDHAEVRYLGNVGVGLGQAEGEGTGGLAVEDLLAHYDQVVFTTGCETDRRLGVAGEDLAGSVSATSFVAWYNGHPDYRDLAVDLTSERAVVVGIGDVAMDLARILLRNPDDLAPTDIADYALEALRRSRIREVVILARRGPGQAAFAAKELEDIGDLEDVHVDVDEDLVLADLAALDPHAGHDKHKLEVLAKLGASQPGTKSRRLVIRFLASPVELVGDAGRVTALRVEANELARDDHGSMVARGSGRFETIDCGLVLRSVGYRGVALPGLPFDDGRGTVPNQDGRVLHRGSVMPRVYVAGWIKRGASGVVGTNKGDAAATVARMLEDVAALEPRDGAVVARAAIDRVLAERRVRVVTWEAWKRIDVREHERGAAAGKVRDKLTTVEDLLAAAGV